MRTAMLVLLLVACAAAATLANVADVPPRLLAHYVERRAEGHDRVIEDTGRFVARMLRRVDRGKPVVAGAYPAWAGAARKAPADNVESFTGGRAVTVTTVAELRSALDGALPGDRIVLAPGTYRLSGPPLVLARAGTADKPILVTAAQLDDAVVESTLLEGFQVSAPYWTFENLVVRGVCERDSDCEHAFHVVGGGRHFTARNLVVQDFNAQFKVNGAEGLFPDDGIIERSTLANSRERQTDRPVSPVDIVAASGWRIEGNLIADFVKAGGDGTSYGVFAKGSAAGTRISRNVVLCEHALHPDAGRRVGISLGGGGTDAAYCRDGKCIVEHQAGVLSDNLVAGCSDAGIYLNRAAQSIVARNTLLDTAGIEIRFPESVADLEGNLLDGPVRARDGALVREVDDRTTPAAWLYAGYHPVRAYFADASQLDLDWRSAPPLRESVTTAAVDLCGMSRSAHSAYGAFDDIRRCTDH
ncbi:MAG: right-handed parallel beta-helix repeat-containing protein [Casimicrobiaceae bacterium]